MTTITIQLLCTNDTHSQMEPYIETRHTNSPTVYGGVARRAHLFDSMRESLPKSTLVLDAGDHFTGSPYFDFFQGEAEMNVLEKLKYDAAAFGNHDFDAVDTSIKGGEKGLSRFKTVSKRYAPSVKFLCANIVDATNPNELQFAPSHIFDLETVKVGVVSVLGDHAWQVTSSSLRKGLVYLPFLDVAKKEGERLRDEEGCDVLVCLSHTGLSRGDRELAQLELFDVVFSGHEHLYDAGSNWHRFGKTALSQGMAKGSGIAIARIRLEQAVATNKWVLVDNHTEARMVTDDIPSSTAIQNILGSYRMQFETTRNEIVGQCSKNLTLPNREEVSIFVKSASHEAVSAALRDEVTRLLELSSSSGPCLVILNKANIWGAPPQRGAVTLGMVRDMLPFRNNIAMAELQGTFLLAIVRRNTKYLLRADYLYVDGMNWEVVPDSNGDETTFQCVGPTISNIGGAQMVDANEWYWCIIDDYVLDTLLENLPERDAGVRNRTTTDTVAADLVTSFLRRGGVLGGS